ncbi:hypothetical protein TNCT_237151 [Trichonephila clavata]|uniref:DUF5641 domain-containing protein n=1 Tax=Trichonephila clavata TaxID=2740835 RepID=A0A8X6LI85_TRICU|nr:hypothetical protein TNCT_237151 [Trichonephila clavata]
MGSPKAASDNYSSVFLFVQSHGILDLWRLETIGIKDPCETDSSKDLENKVIDYFFRSVKTDEDGRYEKSTYSEVKPGEIDLLEDDSKKSLLWHTTKVLEVYPGKDNTFRVVRLKTQCGEAVRRIHPLKIKCTDDGSHSIWKPVTARSDRTVKVTSRF